MKRPLLGGVNTVHVTTDDGEVTHEASAKYLDAGSAEGDATHELDGDTQDFGKAAIIKSRTAHARAIKAAKLLHHTFMFLGSVF